MEKCRERIGRERWPCANNAKIERNGRWYCGVHDPLRPDKLTKRAAARDRSQGEMAQWRRDVASKRACVGLTLPDDVAEGALAELVAAARAQWVGKVARYDQAVEADAAPLREDLELLAVAIKTLQHQQSAKNEALKALYAYQVEVQS